MQAGVNRPLLNIFLITKLVSASCLSAVIAYAMQAGVNRPKTVAKL